MHYLRSAETKQMRFQVTLKPFWPYSWMTQIGSEFQTVEIPNSEY